jgi:uncharacterized small protein (TIGR04563 family)
VDQQLDGGVEFHVLPSRPRQGQPLAFSRTTVQEAVVSQKRKVTLYFNAAMLAETQREALRQDRSISWIIQASWRIARDMVKQMPSTVSPSVHAENGSHPVQTGMPDQSSIRTVSARTQA